MDWSIVGPAIFSLIGVALGTSGSLIGQYLGTRTTKEQARAARHAALRQERKEAIREFLETAQQVEHIAEQRYFHGSRAEESVALTHRMWYLQKCIDLVGAPPLRRTAEEYAWRLMAAVYKDLPEGVPVWDFIYECRDPFMEAAREELGILNAEAPTEQDH